MVSSAATLPNPFGFASHLCSGDRAPSVDLPGPDVDFTAPGFARAPVVTCRCFVRMVKFGEPPLWHCGAPYANNGRGKQMVVDHYDIVDLLNAACDAVTPGLASELGSQGIRGQGVSPGPGMHHAFSGTEPFDKLLDHAVQRSPQCDLVGIGGLGCAATGLAFYCERGMSGIVDIADACVCLKH